MRITAIAAIVLVLSNANFDVFLFSFIFVEVFEKSFAVPLSAPDSI